MACDSFVDRNNVTVTCINSGDLQDVLEENERLLWSGVPEYGRRFWQAAGQERRMHLGLFLGSIAIWMAFPFVEEREGLSEDAPIVFLVISVALLLWSFFIASQRQFVLANVVYFVTDRRALICRRGLTVFLRPRLYLVSCPLSASYPYSILGAHPFPSLQIGTLLSKDQVQPFGFGLAHLGQPLLQDRITAPIVFEAIKEPDKLIALMRSHAPSGS